MASVARAVPRRLGRLSVQARLCMRSGLRPPFQSVLVHRRCFTGAAVKRTSSTSQTPGEPDGVSTLPDATLDSFPRRHIGPDHADTAQMLASLSPPVKDIDTFISEVVPPDIRSSPLDNSLLLYKTERGLLSHAKKLLRMPDARYFIGQGYYPTLTPSVIQRNVLESPAWYTSYTPYQAEISQGRLESLVNFQTMVSDLTALPIANASLLDEGTAAAEAMTLSINSLSSSRAKRQGRTMVVSQSLHPQTIAVMRGRADGFGINIKELDLSSDSAHADIESLGEDLVGVMVQYPDTYGKVENFQALSDLVHKQGALLSVATDLLALTLLKPPGEWGADIAFGSAQRFGVPMGAGGPHAAFFAVNEKHKRKIPGRLVGLSKDRMGQKAFRLALQTREQHIRREKATSNVCTSQALLANMSAFFGVYHGPEGLRAIAERVVRGARVIQTVAEGLGFKTRRNKLDDGCGVLFDTVIVQFNTVETRQHFEEVAELNDCYFRTVSADEVGISLGESTNMALLSTVAGLLQSVAQRPGKTTKLKGQDKNAIRSLISKTWTHQSQPLDIPETVRRTSSYMEHPVFNTHHSETELLRYIYHLQSKDLSLVHSMIPLGSCTMKLNGTTEMSLITLPKISALHPFGPSHAQSGLRRFLKELERQLSTITGMDAVSLQPNSGAQGEFAGLRAIKDFQKSTSKEGEVRDICLIPVSAHGTNPASAAMAGMRVVPIKCDTKTGNLDLADLEAKCVQHADQLAAIMITYPSTFGVFEPEIKKACRIVHDHGGQVYMDGANMNAQIGLCSPGDIGADVCHLNLHKTFCIPHGGGGPGVGPICVKNHLQPFLPGNPNAPATTTTTTTTTAPTSGFAVSSAEYGSASINLISWAYILLMGSKGLKQATEITLLNANYILSRLQPHYPILYTNEHGRCAHEFILDARPFSKSAGIDAVDIAKRLQDYGFHAPTMSWPVANTLMIEPTESESKEELDRFVDALISIREEIRDVEEGRASREGNVLKMAPHPMRDLIQGDGDGQWKRSYSREKAAYPLPWLKEKKFWPSVARIDDTYGDLNLFCTCPPVEDTTGVPVKETTIPSVEDTTSSPVKDGAGGT
ncbi:glycine dehydrogenase [Xylariaceae sp. FL0804]|nr:glycine dehydrogenase [Xylariaceae sp. FL0804]